MGKKSSDVVIMKVPKEFKQFIDKRRLDEGYNNRERQKYLRDLMKKDDPFQELGLGGDFDGF